MVAGTDVLVHVHIPKSGGTSVRVWLYRGCPYGFGAWYPDYDFDETTLAAAGLGDPRLRALSTHNIRRFPAVSCGRTMRYVTLLRDPVEQHLSFVHYLKQMIADGVMPPLALPPDAASLSSRALTAWLLDSAPDGAHDDPQTAFLADHAWRERAADPADAAAYRRERLGLAMDVLRGFAAVGTLERLHDSLDLVRRRAEAWGFALRPAREVGHENVTQIPRDDASWVSEDDAVGRRFLASVADDRALYAYAERLLDEGRAAVT
ncbi:MAG: hypothetical protein JOZ86_15955 [Candidatus Eremiobacteraeota bacterium]|nr:hypothetical protein [Candidatus Eremiobacteraeota bacterium]